MLLTVRECVDVAEQREDAILAGGRKDLFEYRYEHSFLRLLRADELPPISRISTFENAKDLCFQRWIEGASPAGIGPKMPNLERVVWFVHDDERNTQRCGGCIGLVSFKSFMFS